MGKKKESGNKFEGIVKKILGTVGYVIVKNAVLEKSVKDTTTRNLASTGIDAVLGFTDVLPENINGYISKEYLQIKTGTNLLKTALETNKLTSGYTKYIQNENEITLIRDEDEFLEDEDEFLEGEDEAFLMGEEFEYDGDSATMQGERIASESLIV